MCVCPAAHGRVTHTHHSSVAHTHAQQRNLSRSEATHQASSEQNTECHTCPNVVGVRGGHPYVFSDVSGAQRCNAMGVSGDLRESKKPQHAPLRASHASMPHL